MGTGLIELLIALIILGAILYIVQRSPLEAWIKMVINVVAVVAVCIYLLRLLSHTSVPLWR